MASMGQELATKWKRSERNRARERGEREQKEALSQRCENYTVLDYIVRLGLTRARCARSNYGIQFMRDEGIDTT